MYSKSINVSEIKVNAINITKKNYAELIKDLNNFESFDNIRRKNKNIR
jgi:hypothetical protein